MKYALLAVLVLATGVAWKSASAEPTYAERLGWGADDRVVIFHCDDAGMSHSSNRGAIEALEYGMLTSVSTMMPCGWVPEFAAYLKEHPNVDNGLHLTHTSEWSNYRWGPVAGKTAVPGLADEQGCLWDNVPLVLEHATADEIETEIRAQIERAERMGMPITHLDSHMGTLFADDAYFERFMKVAIEKRIPMLIAGGHLTHVRQGHPEAAEKIVETAEMIWDAGLPVIDDIHTDTYDWKDPATKKAELIETLRKLKPGITEIIVHCTNPSDAFEHISDSGPNRLADLRVMTDPDVKRVLEEQGIILTTWRELKERRDKAG